MVNRFERCSAAHPGRGALLMAVPMFVVAYLIWVIVRGWLDAIVFAVLLVALQTVTTYFIFRDPAFRERAQRRRGGA